MAITENVRLTGKWRCKVCGGLMTPHTGDLTLESSFLDDVIITGITYFQCVVDDCKAICLPYETIKGTG